MRNATQQLHKPAWPRRRANKFSAAVAAALRPGHQKSAAATTNSRRPGQRIDLGLHSSLVTTIHYEYILLDLFTYISLPLLFKLQKIGLLLIYTIEWHAQDSV